LAPYGTGSFDVVIDTKELTNCIEKQQDFINHGHSFSDYTPKNDLFPDPMTPEVDNTPGPYIGSGGSVYDTTPYNR